MPVAFSTVPCAQFNLSQASAPGKGCTAAAVPQWQDFHVEKGPAACLSAPCLRICTLSHQDLGTYGTWEQRSGACELQSKPDEVGQQPAGFASGLAAFGVNAFNALVAGACAAAVARSVTAPWERLKMDLQLGLASRHSCSLGSVVRAEGIKGLWKGNINNIIRSAPFKGCNFMFFDVYKGSLVAVFGHSDAAQFIAGALSGASATLMCYPLDVARTRHLAGSPYGGFWNILRSIPRFEHWTALYSGIGPALVSILPTAGVYFGLYEALKVHHMQQVQDGSCSNGKLPVQYRLLYGAIAGAASEVVGYPFELIRRRMQISPHLASSPAALQPRAVLPGAALPTTAALPAIPSRALTRAVTAHAVLHNAVLSGLLTGAHSSAARLARPLAPMLAALQHAARGNHHLLASARTCAIHLTQPFASLSSSLSRAFVPMAVVASSIWRTKGVLGFYTGLNRSLVSCVISSATGYCVYEATVEWLRDVESGRVGLEVEVLGMLCVLGMAARSVLLAPAALEDMQMALQLEDVPA